MTAKNKQLLARREVSGIGTICQVYLSSHLNGQVLNMTIFYLSNALAKKLARQLLNKYTYLSSKKLSFFHNLPQSTRANKLLKEELSMKTWSC